MKHISLLPRGTKKGLCWVVLGRTEGVTGSHLLLSPCARCAMLLRSLQGPDEVKEVLSKLWVWEGVDRGGPTDLQQSLSTSSWGSSEENMGRMTQWGRGGRCPAGAHMWADMAGQWGSTKAMSRLCLPPKRGRCLRRFSVTLVVLLAGVFAGWSEQVCLQVLLSDMGTSPRQFLSHSCKDCLCRWC